MHRKHLFRLLGLSMLVAVGVMAVSASAAQAEWLLLRNNESVQSLDLVGNFEPGELLVPGLGLNIACNDGLGEVSASLSNENKTLSGSGEATFTGCVVKGAEKTCAVEGGGENPGEIVATGSGTAKTVGVSDVLAKLSSPEFAFVEIVGPFCPFNEVGGEIHGDATLLLLDPDEEKELHIGHLDDVALFFGEEPSTIHSGTGDPGAVLLSVTEADNNPWAISLVNLP